MLQLVSQVLQITWHSFLLFVQLVLSLFPFYQQLSGLQTQMIAAFVGVPVTVIAAVTVTIKVLRFTSNRR